MHRPPFPFLLAAALCRAAAAAQQPDPSLVDFSLEQLSEIVVTSVSRQETRLADAPASIYLISGAEIRRSGATTLPEALRLAPNLQVARSDTRTYAITARGFSSTLENKLLVLIDGRSVYSPLFSGVFWDMQDVVMDDIERIEVISGPGATIWGANAVNGVINIITRAAKDSQGGLLSLGAGEQSRNGSARYGGTLAGGHYRVYAMADQYGDTFSEAGQRQDTGWHRSQAGFRADWDASQEQAVTLSGDSYQGMLGQVRGPDIRIGGANLVGRYTRKLDNDADLRLQAYLDHTERDQPNTGAQRLDTLDLEAQQGLRLGDHQLEWGGGYRHTRDRVQNGPLLRFTPAERILRWSNVFAQDELALRPGLRLTAGLKLEHNIYTGVETLPSLRLAWSPDSSRLVWGAAARTVRAPSRIDRDLYLANPAPSAGAPAYLIAGGPDFESETARVFELGYRSQPAAALSYSATLFYSQYDKLRTLEALPDGAVFSNMGEGRAYGIETWARWQPARNWRLSAGAVWQDIDTHLKPGSLDASGSAGLATNDPHCYWSLRSAHDLGAHVQADFGLRYVGSLPQPAVPAYYELDARLAWQLWRNMELALVGQNLLHRSHAEFGSAGTRQVFDRALSLQLAVRL
ncbi:MAG TPA: TonB-dependent receptor [Telluria sp.]|nr:TonB-dependent receptor [Telluria sp.]